MVKETKGNTKTQEKFDLAEAYAKSFRRLSEGDIVKGKVIAIGKKDVYVDFGYKSEGIIPIAEFKDTEVKILLNAKDGKYAALIVIDKGKIYVDGIENSPKENIKKKVAGWDGLLQADTQVFLDLLGGGDVTTGQVVAKILTRKIKIRGIKNVLILMQLFEL